jgi:hypothetical protein
MDWNSRQPLWYDLPEEVRRDLRESLTDVGRAHETSALTHFKGSSARTILDVWLKYNGIIGFTDQLIRVIEGIKGASQ